MARALTTKGRRGTRGVRVGPRARGFTLTELLAVLAVISVLVAAASPSFVRLMRDRRVNRAAMQLVDYVRTGRAMAIGRGQPIVVSWTSNGTNPPTGAISLIEPIVTSVTAPRTCAQTQWGTVGATQVVSSLNLLNQKYELASATFFDDSGATPNKADICFSPTGRMYMRSGSGTLGAFHAVVGVPSFSVLNTSTGLIRRIFIPPNGVARLDR